jgi:hypothetical protein
MANEQMYSDPRLYDDGSGRGAVVNTPIATPELAMKNMQTRRPGGAAYVQLPGGPGQVKANVAANEDIETDEQETQPDYLESLFDGENLSEEFMQKTAVIFEAAINEKVAIIEQSILEAAKEIIEEQVEQKTQHLTEQLDNYLNYVITEWMEENQVAVERGLRTEIAEHFMVGLKELLSETFIDVPEEKYDVLDEMATANEELQNQLNEQIKKNIELSNEITARLCAESFMEISGGLTDTEVEKLAQLAEGIEFSNVQQYSEKVKLLKESYFNHQPKSVAEINQQQNLFEESNDPRAFTSTPEMSALVNAMSRINKNAKPAPKKIDEKTNAGKLLNMINPNIVSDQYI